MYPIIITSSLCSNDAVCNAACLFISAHNLHTTVFFSLQSWFFMHIAKQYDTVMKGSTSLELCKQT